MAIIHLYKNLLPGESFTQNQLKATRNATEINFIERLDQIGSFEFVLPARDGFCELVEEDYIIGIDNQYFGTVRQLKQMVECSKNYVVISGEDLKGFLKQRITLYPATVIDVGLQGFDAIKDVSTETLVKYFINNNIVNPTNPARKIVGFEIAPDQNRGAEKDQYMSRFEQLNDVLLKNLEPQKMGYKVDVDLLNSKFIFDVIKGVDRTGNQTENGRIIFDAKLRNLIDLEFFKSNQDYKNIFYATLSKYRTSQEALTCMYYREQEEEESQGAKRFEKHLNVSVNLPDSEIYQNMKSYALKDANAYERVETLNVNVSDKYQYGINYSLGDFVTIQARYGLFKQQLAQIDTQITTITHRWVGDRILHTLGLGTGKVSRFEKLKRSIRNGGI